MDRIARLKWSRSVLSCQDWTRVGFLVLRFLTESVWSHIESAQIRFKSKCLLVYFCKPI